jgi:peroxiredoxin
MPTLPRQKVIMTGTVKAKIVTVTVLMLAALGGLGLLWRAPEASQRAPDISFTTLRGDTLNIAELRGRPVLVSFWATTCPGCVREIPQLVELYNEFAAQGLEVIGIAMAYDPPNQVVALSEARRIPYPIALDINSAAARAFGGVQLTPTSFLIAPDGQVIHRSTGQLDMYAVRAMVAGMLTTADNRAQQSGVN